MCGLISPLFVLDKQPPRDVHTLILGTYKCVLLHGKRDFVDEIE